MVSSDFDKSFGRGRTVVAVTAPVSRCTEKLSDSVHVLFSLLTNCSVMCKLMFISAVADCVSDLKKTTLMSNTPRIRWTLQKMPNAQFLARFWPTTEGKSLI